MGGSGGVGGWSGNVGEVWEDMCGGFVTPVTEPVGHVSKKKEQTVT